MHALLDTKDMNKNIYRLVFSAERGMLVAVQESAEGGGKGRHGSAKRQDGGTAFAPVLWLTVLAASMMGIPVVLDQTARAQTLPIQVDKNAAGARPYVGTAANGTPVVNIAPPQRNGGTSVNSFIQYNVGPSGVVINNSGGSSQTQIAGWVQGNQQLGNNYAGTIVQQVTTPNPSQLLGMQEIAGNRAALVVANPAGITCSGCGTINADRFTLSTGRALYGPDGSLAGFDVSQGNMAIGGQGLSSPQAQVDLLARSISVNADIWARYLNAIAGANQVDYQNLNATPQAGAGPRPQFALDASALGSMFSGAVRLVGTEKGVGFNLGGNIAASTGDITVDTNGDVRILPSARLQAQGGATVFGSNIDNAGTITARGAVNVTSPGQLSNTGTMAAGTDLQAMADSMTNHGTIGAGVDANANVTGAGTAILAARTTLQSDGNIVSGADANLSAPNLKLSNGSIIAHGTANLSASGDIQHQNARLEGNAVQVQAGGTLDNRNGSIVAGTGGTTLQAATILNHAGTTTSGGNLAINAAQSVDNTGGTIAGTGATTVAAASVVNRGGTLGSAQDSVTVQGTLDNTGGKTLATDELRVSGGPITNDQGQMAGQNVSLNAGSQALSNAGGTIQGGTGATTLTAASVDNAAGSITSTGTLAMQTPGAVNNQGGTLAANGATTVSASQISNQGGVLGSAQASLAATAPLDNTGGKTLAATDMTLTGGLITNTNGQISAGHSLTLDTATQALVNTAGVISATDLNASTGAFDNQGGVVQATGAVAVDTHEQTYDNSQGGLTVANGAVTLDTDALNNAGGAVSGRQAVTLTASTVDNTAGKIRGGGPLGVTADSLTNAGGQLASKGHATLRIANTLDNTAGFTHSGGTLDVQAGTVINRNTLGGTDTNPLGMEGSTVQVAANAIDNTQGVLQADSALTAAAATLDNTQGQMTSGGTAQLSVGATTNTQGLLSANQALGVTGTSLTGDGTVQSQGDVNLKLASDFNNTGTVTAGRNATLDTTGDVNNAGSISAGQALDVHGRNLSNSGELYGQGSNHLRADQAIYNNGLIDGGAVRIDAGTTVTNVDRIYGDSVSVGAGQQILNDANPATGNGGVIASRSGDVNLGAPDIVNREHALIYTSQDLNVGGTLDADGRATGQANSFTNDSATIDVTRNANINAANIQNQNSHFATTVTDTGTVSQLTYRLKGSTSDIDPTTAIIFDYRLGSTDYYHPGTDLGWLYRDGNERGAPRWLVLPSDQYPFSTFGPPFDWSRRIDGTPGPILYWGSNVGTMLEGDNVFTPLDQWSPVGLAFAQYTQQDNLGTVLAVTNERFYYQPGDAIWDKFGVPRPSSAPPPFQGPCAQDAPASCQVDYQTYQAWHDANFSKHLALNDKIKAFNQDFHARSVSDFYSVNEHTRTRDETVASTDPARILVGGNAALNGVVVNDKSQILVGGTLTVQARVDNRGYTGTRIETVTGSQDWNYVNYGVNNPDRRMTSGALPPVNINLPLVLATGSTLDHQVITGTGTTVAGKTDVGPIANAPTMLQVSLDAGGAASGPQLSANGPGSSLGGAVIRAVTPSLAVPRNALFTVNTQPDARYLIETDPRFTDQRQWLSSDYILKQLGQDPDNVLKRLGDGFYEARLAADAVMLGTGQRFVGNYTDNEQQYIGLMKSGVTFAQQFHLNVGTELTAEQMAALTSDIVWLVRKTVTLPDGTTQDVLVPQVYLMTRVGDLTGDGTLIAANNTVIRTTGDVKNTGTIASRNLTLIDAGNIVNERGTLSAGTMVLNASQDIDNLAGTISAGKLSASAGGDINLTTTTATGSNQSGQAAASHTVVSGVSTLNVDSATLMAGRDINAQAASIAATGDLGMGAGRNLNLDTVQVGDRRDSVADARNSTSTARSADIGTQISGQNVTLVAGQDVNARAAYVNADSALDVSAGRDINVTAGQSSVSIRDQQGRTSGGFLSKSSTHTIDAASQTDAIGSTFSGDSVTMNAGRDLTVAGSTVAGTHDVNLSAKRNLDITTTETQSSAYSFKEEKKSGFGATGGGISYGKRDQKDTTHDNGTQQVGSLVGSTDGSVHLNAGSTLTIKGSDLIARQDITGKGADVNIEAAQNLQHHDEAHELKQSGFTLGVSGGALGAAMNAGNKISSASKSQDGRASALWGIAAGRDLYEAGSALGDAGGTSGAAGADGAKGAGQGVAAGVSLSWGTSQSKQTLTQDSTSHRGSRVSAGSTAAFQATGVDADGNQTAGKLNLVGSDIDARKVALQAKNDVNIVSATNTDESHSTNASKSASVGVSYSFGQGMAGIGVSASASKANGNSDSTGTSQSDSHVRGSDSVTIVSENDSNILGGTVRGGKVSMDVGGNLNLASRQDTEAMHARQQSASGGVSISQGGGSASLSAMQGKANGSYANVSEQSGIQAGQDGFDINVKGNTDLKGAVIASDATKDKNRLTTGTLTYSDLQNHSDYSATSVGVSVGTGGGLGGFTPMIPQHESHSQNGAAQSAIADGTITIKDQASQTRDLAGLKRDTAATNSQVGNNPDLKNVLDKQADMMAAAQAAGAAIAKTVGDIADSRLKDAQGRFADAEKAYQKDASPENKAAMDAAQADIAGWKEGGGYRAELHAAGGAMVAGLGGGSALAGAAGAGLSSLATPKLGDLKQAVADGLNTGNDKANAALGNLVANVVAGGIGAAVGGGSGAAMAANVDAYNRQLHPEEKAKILAQANGDKAEEERLTRAACFEVKCWAEYPVGSDAYNKNYVSAVEASQLGPELDWIHRQQQANLFVYTPAQKIGDAVKSDPLGVAKDAAKVVLGGVTAKTGAGICATSGAGCVAGGPMIAFGLSDMAEGADGLYNRYAGIASPGVNPLRWAANQISPTWGNTLYDGANLATAMVALTVPVPLKVGIADGMNRPGSIFDVTVPRFDNQTLNPITKLPLPYGTTQGILLYGVGSKGVTVLNDLQR
ncbi:hemagglutinin repeat-containing protein [Cupriavidus sp. TMH.W2]|uniref:hemagglutinin repeat-containing protein n=1 Tax=Cupriavidus sp. TMH.W2 TaxID=3434465 RepID=UPI003D785989